MRPGSRLLIAAALSLSAISPLVAYSVQPMIYAMTPNGSGSSVRLTISNTRDAQLNVELLPFAVTADAQGKRTFVPAPDDFLIFPPQASIAADRSQVFQVRYIGAADMPKGRAFVIRVRQTNTIDTIKNDPAATAQTQLKLALNFNTTAIVQSRDMAGELVVEQDLAPGQDGITRARIANRGNGVIDLTRAGWTIERGGRREPLALEDVQYGEAIFLEPGHVREIALSAKVKDGTHLQFALPAARRGRPGA